MRPQPMALLLLLTLPSAMAEAQLAQGATTTADLALAGATQTLGGEAAALFANPAGLHGAGSRLLFGLGLVSTSAHYHDEALQSRNLSGPRPLGYAVGTISLWHRHIVAALAYRRRTPAFTRYAPTPDEENALPLRFLGRSASWDEHEVSLAVATSWRWFAFGATFSTARVKVDLERALFAGSEDDLALLGTRRHDVDLETALEGLALTGSFGITFIPWWWIRAAITVVLPRHTQLEGEASFADPASRPSGIVDLETQTKGAEANFDMPWRLAGGLALHVTRSLRLFFQLDLIMPEQKSPLVLKETRWLANGREVPLAELTLLPKAQIATSCRLAVELSLWGGHLRLRGGWAIAQGSYGAAGLGALLFDVQRHELGGGLVLHGERVQLSLGFKHIFAAELQPPSEGLPVIAPLHEGDAITAAAGRIDLSRTQLALEVEVTL